MQLAHMLAGLGAMLAPHMQHSTVPGVPAAAYIALAGLAVVAMNAMAHGAAQQRRDSGADTAHTGREAAREK